MKGASPAIPGEPNSRPPIVVTALEGNDQSYTTSDLAIRVTIHVHAPVGGALRARPTVNGEPIRGSEGAGVYVCVAPDGWTLAPLTITTEAGSNDVVIVEEF